MSKVKNLSVQPESPDLGIQVQTEISDIATTLHSLEGTGSKLKVSISDQAEHYSSFVLSVLDQGDNFQIDELIPFDGNNLMNPGVELSMEVQTQEVKIWFSSTLREATISDGIRSYSCEYPEKIELQQKRKHYRIGFILLDRPSLSVKVGDTWLQRVKLSDLSPSGVGIALSNIPDQLQTGEEIYCRMTVHGQEYPFFATVTHISEKPRHRGFHIGLKFTEESLSPDFTRRLSKYMMTLQRKRIRNWADVPVDN